MIHTFSYPIKIFYADTSSFLNHNFPRIRYSLPSYPLTLSWPLLLAYFLLRVPFDLQWLPQLLQLQVSSRAASHHLLQEN